MYWSMAAVVATGLLIGLRFRAPALIAATAATVFDLCLRLRTRRHRRARGCSCLAWPGPVASVRLLGRTVPRHAVAQDWRVQVKPGVAAEVPELLTSCDRPSGVDGAADLTRAG
jgi:hypothetical protein